MNVGRDGLHLFADLPDEFGDWPKIVVGALNRERGNLEPPGDIVEAIGKIDGVDLVCRRTGHRMGRDLDFHSPTSAPSSSHWCSRSRGSPAAQRRSLS